MPAFLTKLNCITGACLLILTSAQSQGVAQQLTPATPDTTVSNILEDADSDSAAQLAAPGNTPDSLSVSRDEALPVISAPDWGNGEVIDALSADQVLFEQKNRSVTIIDIQ